MIQVEGLTRAYGDFRAIDGVSFEVGAKEIVGFLGPNGAGKTTTMKILTGFLAPTAGRALIQGLDVTQHPLEVRRKIGYLPENAPIYPEMRVGEYLSFVAALRDIPARGQRAAVERAMERTGLLGEKDSEIRVLSKGYRQRVGLAQAILADPPVLILDEPTSGLDPNQIAEIRALIKSLGEEHTVLFSTHILAEVEATCRRALVISQGKTIADGSLEDLRARGGPGRLAVGFATEGAPEPAVLEAELRAMEGVLEVKPQKGEPGVLSYTLSGKDDLRARLFRFAVDKGLTLLELRREEVSLEAVFQQLTRS